MSMPTAIPIVDSQASEVTRGTKPSSSDSDDARYTVGTLRYTRAALVMVFVWMLWGDFCFTMMERLLAQVTPLQLRSAGGSNANIGLLVGIIPGIMNMVITPIVSFRSDRHRGPRGRRIPFLLWPTPLVALFLALLGYSPQLGRWIHSLFPTGMSAATMSMTVFGIVMVVFQLFHMIVASVYYYLFNDVVPAAFLGRFVALFGIVSSGAAFSFNLWVFPFAESHASQIYLAMGFLYFAAFWLMCRYVREGNYPPPPVDTQRPDAIESTKVYFRECFKDPLYLLVFARMAFWSVAMTSATYATFFGQQIGLNLTEIGRINAANMLVLTLALYPMGALVDRLHPVRMHLLALLILPLFGAGFFIFARGYWSLMLISVLVAPIMALMSASVFPLITAIFPKDRFGQFCSAQALLNAIALMAGSYLLGRWMDRVGDYRYLYLWMTVFQMLSALCMAGAYFLWRRRSRGIEVAS